jgi:hypothetical protein
MSELEYDIEMKRIKRENSSRRRIQKLQEEKNKLKKKHKLPPTSKLVLLVVFALSIQIIAFVEFVMLKYGDFSAAYALIGIPVTIVPTILGYYHKSKAENTQGGIIYEKAMMENDEDDDESVG